MYPPISELAARVRPLDLSDSIGKAAEQIRLSSGRAAPVAVNGHVLGVITAADLIPMLSSNPEEARTLPVAAMQLRPAYGIPDFWSADRAFAYFRKEGLECAPVLDATGRYVGMVSTADLATALCGRLRPRSIGGMATPFGVYLTDGAVRGGVGDVALMTAGVYIGALHLVAVILTCFLIGETGLLSRFPAGLAWLQHADLERARAALVMVVFAACFRLSRISGFHAAEHQVVHTIEAGDDLRPTVVRSKPRVHPRCGTNLVVGLMLLWLLWICAEGLRRLGEPGDLFALAAFLLTLFTWRRLGGVVQHFITTRPACDAEIASGIRAGEQLLQNYQTCRPGPRPRWHRLWNIGICQVLLGFIAVMFTVWLVNLIVPIPGVEILW
jgi:CBS domain-containing protein